MTALTASYHIGQYVVVVRTDGVQYVGPIATLNEDGTVKSITLYNREEYVLKDGDRVLTNVA